MLLYSCTLAYPRTVSPYVSVSPYISIRSLPLHKSCCSRFFYCQLVNLVASQLILLPVNFIVSYSYISISSYSVFTETRVHLPPRETAARYKLVAAVNSFCFILYITLLLYTFSDPMAQPNVPAVVPVAAPAAAPAPPAPAQPPRGAYHVQPEKYKGRLQDNFASWLMHFDQVAAVNNWNNVQETQFLGLTLEGEA